MTGTAALDSFNDGEPSLWPELDLGDPQATFGSKCGDCGMLLDDCPEFGLARFLRVRLRPTGVRLPFRLYCFRFRLCLSSDSAFSWWDAHSASNFAKNASSTLPLSSSTMDRGQKGSLPVNEDGTQPAVRAQRDCRHLTELKMPTGYLRRPSLSVLFVALVELYYPRLYWCADDV